jgi:hypothetical protein
MDLLSVSKKKSHLNNDYAPNLPYIRAPGDDPDRSRGKKRVTKRKSNLKVNKVVEEHKMTKTQKINNHFSHHKVSLNISCRKLLKNNQEFIDMEKCDPFAVLFVRNESDPEFEEVGRTDPMINQVSPDFVEWFDLNYQFECNQLIRVEVYDNDAVPELIGFYECAINKVLTAPNQHHKADLLYPDDVTGRIRGKVIIKADSVA